MILSTILSFIDITTDSFGSSGTQKIVMRNGIGLGAVISVVASWQRNRSIGWAILHGIFSWFYVIYFASTRREDERKQF